jgi:hypothetical protein
MACFVITSRTCQRGPVLLLCASVSGPSEKCRPSQIEIEEQRAVCRDTPFSWAIVISDVKGSAVPVQGHTERIPNSTFSVGFSLSAGLTIGINDLHST